MSGTPKWDVDRPLPSLAKFTPLHPSHGKLHYVVADPEFLATGHTIDSQGSAVSDTTQFFAVFGALAGALVAVCNAVMWIEHPVNEFIGGAFFGVLGLFAGAVAGTFLGMLTDLLSGDGRRGFRKKTGKTVFVQRVEDQGSIAWRLCAIVDELARTQIWSQGELDVRERVPEILWSAVLRANEMRDLTRVLAESEQHSALHDLAAGQREPQREVEASLKGVEIRLDEVRRLALGEDQRRARAERAREAAAIVAWLHESVTLLDSVPASPQQTHNRER